MNGCHRHRHVVQGRVQGVGFRPFIYRLALKHGLTGFVQNAPEGVIIEVQGHDPALADFARELVSSLPPLALIVKHLQETGRPVSDEGEFAILESLAGEDHAVLVSPDIATCPDCLADMADPANRRFRYPFTNCTNCGPRYTITRSVPYDRDKTSMACFPMCPECSREYDDPLDRRFHAQPNACPACGPSVWLANPSGLTLAQDGEAISLAADGLAHGRILAVKGLGGFHLAANAANHETVAELRRRKRRPAKPLAVMVPDLETLAGLAEFGPEEQAMLTGQERPIVLVKLKEGHGLSPYVSPDTDFLGVMLPYTPLHHVLLGRFRELLPQASPCALVMTSGNASSEPIALGNREALERLGAMADLFLLHDRDILVRTDDSVVRCLPPTESFPARTQFLRRARGYTPQPVFLSRPGPSVLGLGPEQKCTVCLTKDDQAFLSQHIGDMHNLETALFHQEVRAHLQDILRVKPQALVGDLHPDYLATRFALEQRELPVYLLQHHYAHIMAVLAENRLEAPALGLALDGTGFGPDGTIWGGEMLYVDPMALRFECLGHLSPIPMPGGEAAINHPWRMAQAFFHALGQEPGGASWPWLAHQAKASALVGTMLDKGIHSPMTTSCGRLFDAVAAMLGLVMSITYEGQAAIVLERAQDQNETGAYACPLLTGQAPAVLNSLALFDQAAKDWAKGTPAPVVSRRFHLGLANGLTQAAAELAGQHGLKHVALSGGVFLNRTMMLVLPELLRRAGLIPVVHRHAPPGDGCISLGQAFYGQRAVTLGFSPLALS